jgi:hypothetical protein
MEQDAKAQQTVLTALDRSVNGLRDERSALGLPYPPEGTTAPGSS